MCARKKNRLRNILQYKVRSVIDKVVQSNGQVAPEQLGELERLVRLVNIQSNIQSSRRWVVVSILGVSLLITGILFFARVQETTIELDLAVTAIGFEIATKEPYASNLVMSSNMKLSTLGILELSQVELPDEGKEEAKRLYLTAITDEDHQGKIGLAPLALSEDTAIHLGYRGHPNEYRLLLDNFSQDEELRVTFVDPVEVWLDNFLVNHPFYAIPRPILANPASNELTLNLTLPESTVNPFFSSIYARNLSLYGVEEFRDTDINLPIDISYILSGTLYLKSLNNIQRSIDSGDFIQFKHVEGVIQNILVHQDHIALRFYGRAQGITRGLESIGIEEFSLMPTYLEWLKARHGVELFGCAFIYLLGAIVFILRLYGLHIKMPNL